MSLHYQTCICISGHSKFDMDWDPFFYFAKLLLHKSAVYFVY